MPFGIRTHDQPWHFSAMTTMPRPKNFQRLKEKLEKME
jgi:hypothetical protein